MFRAALLSAILSFIAILSVWSNYDDIVALASGNSNNVHSNPVGSAQMNAKEIPGVKIRAEFSRLEARETQPETHIEKEHKIEIENTERQLQQLARSCSDHGGRIVLTSQTDPILHPVAISERSARDKKINLAAIARNRQVAKPVKKNLSKRRASVRNKRRVMSKARRKMRLSSRQAQIKKWQRQTLARILEGTGD